MHVQIWDPVSPQGALEAALSSQVAVAPYICKVGFTNVNSNPCIRKFGLQTALGRPCGTLRDPIGQDPMFAKLDVPLCTAAHILEHVGSCQSQKDPKAALRSPIAKTHEICTAGFPRVRSNLCMQKFGVEKRSASQTQTYI